MPSVPLIISSQRFHNETHTHGLLHHGDVEVAPLVGVYSTEAHPFGLVYEYMSNLDLTQYLRNGSNVEKLKLVLISIPFICYRSDPLSFPLHFLPTVDGSSSGLEAHARPGRRPRKPPDGMLSTPHTHVA